MEDRGEEGSGRGGSLEESTGRVGRAEEGQGKDGTARWVCRVLCRLVSH